MPWDASNPKNRSSWLSQHPSLPVLDPPYVYHVFKDDFEGLVDAVRSAVANPIERYVFSPTSPYRGVSAYLKITVIFQRA